MTFITGSVALERSSEIMRYCRHDKVKDANMPSLNLFEKES